MCDNDSHYAHGFCLNFIYFDIQTTAINRIRQKVRYAEDEDNPELLSFWLMAEQTMCTGSSTFFDEDARWQLYQGQFRLLLDVNCGQSSNDVVPSTIHISVALGIEKGLLPALEQLPRLEKNS